MNQELVQAVRELKLKGISDENIITNLSAQFEMADILVCVEALKDMQPYGVQSGINIQPAVTIQESGLQQKPRNRHYKAICFLSLIFLFIFVEPTFLKYFGARQVDKLDAILVDKYEVEKSFDAGSTTTCTHQGPTHIGEVTGVTVCSLVSAKVYYPRVKTSKVKLTTYDHGKPVEEVNEYIQYVDKKGSSLQDYILLGTPIQQIGQGNAYYVDTKLGLKGFDHIVFSGLDGSSGDDLGLGSAKNKSIGKWYWASNPSWLGYKGSGDELRKQIDAKITSDFSPSPGALTGTQALAEGNAPLVAYFITRYCHNPNIPVLDNFCILPN